MKITSFSSIKAISLGQKGQCSENLTLLQPSSMSVLSFHIKVSTMAPSFSVLSSAHLMAPSALLREAQAEPRLHLGSGCLHGLGEIQILNRARDAGLYVSGLLHTKPCSCPGLRFFDRCLTLACADFNSPRSSLQTKTPRT